MKKFLCVILTIALLCAGCLAEGSQTPPEIPEGGMGDMTPPDMQGGMGGDGQMQTPPDMPEGEGGDMSGMGGMNGQNGMGDMNGQGGFGGMGDMNGQGGMGDMNGQGGIGDMGGMNGQMPGGMGGGMSGAPESYDAVVTLTGGETRSEDVQSTGADESAVLSAGGENVLENAAITRENDSSTGGDNSSFYGTGASVLVTEGTLSVNNCVITASAAGGAGVFAYGNGTAYVSDTTITTYMGTSGGIHVAGGGTLYAENLTVETYGASSAAIRSDRGGGNMYVSGGSYTSNGTGSPAVYVTADIQIENAVLTATGSEALCLEGKNSVSLTNCALSGAMKDDSQNDNTWTVILYQSMSGDSEIGEGSFTMTGGSLSSSNGGLFYTTNTTSVFTVENVSIEGEYDYFLRCTGNKNARGWGSTGKNGAECRFNLVNQNANGDVIWDSISTLNLNLTSGSVLTGAIIDDESCAGEGGSGACYVTLDESSVWVVTADSVVTSISLNGGSLVDAEGNSVSVVNAEGEVLIDGTSAITVTAFAATR